MIITDIKKLTQECEDVVSVAEALSIVDQLTAELDKTTGIGLAANQIGIHKKVFIISVPETILDDGKPCTYTIKMHFANPQIVKLEEPIYFSNEGCLSFPEERCNTVRFNKVIIRDLLSAEGRELHGLRAVVAQHELDHVFGITMHKRKQNAIDSNDPCPCRSGKKFKKCCFKIIKKATF